MLVYPNTVYHCEASIVETFPGAGFHLLPYWRLGIVTDAKHPANKLTPFCGPLYSVIIAFAAVRIGGPMLRRVHRIAYVNVAGFPSHVDCDDPDHDSDNLIDPTTFIAGKVE